MERGDMDATPFDTVFVGGSTVFTGLVRERKRAPAHMQRFPFHRLRQTPREVDTKALTAVCYQILLMSLCVYNPVAQYPNGRLE